jgi:hypothetical protein
MQDGERLSLDHQPSTYREIDPQRRREQSKADAGKTAASRRDRQPGVRAGGHVACYLSTHLASELKELLLARLWAWAWVTFFHR